MSAPKVVSYKLKVYNEKSGDVISGSITVVSSDDDDSYGLNSIRELFKQFGLVVLEVTETHIIS